MRNITLRCTNSEESKFNIKLGCCNIIKLLAFDLWNTLIHEGPGYSSVNELLAALELDIPRDQFRKIFQEVIETRTWDSKHIAYRKFCEVIGVEPSRFNIELIAHIRDEVKDRVQVYPNTISMLQQLKKLGLKTGILSNSDNFTIQALRPKLRLFNIVDYQIFSFEIGVTKPDPRIFEEILNVSECKPEQTIMVGDSRDDDILPAIGVGMNVIHFQGYERLKDSLETFSIRIT